MLPAMVLLATNSQMSDERVMNGEALSETRLAGGIKRHVDPNARRNETFGAQASPAVITIPAKTLPHSI